TAVRLKAFLLAHQAVRVWLSPVSKAATGISQSHGRSSGVFSTARQTLGNANQPRPAAKAMMMEERQAVMNSAAATVSFSGSMSASEYWSVITEARIPATDMKDPYKPKS